MSGRGRGQARGQAPGRGIGGRGRGGGAPAPSAGARPPTLPGASVKAVGVKRTGFGTVGRRTMVKVNAFETAIPDGIIHHYDVAMSPSEQKLPRRATFEIISLLQEQQTALFTPRAAYDGRKNMFSMTRYRLGDNDTASFELARGRQTYKIRISHVAEINPESLRLFIEGRKSQDNDVLTAITALNVVVRMEPSKTLPFNTRSFYTERGKRPLPQTGLELWRGYFQSVRPAIGRMIINIDITTALPTNNIQMLATMPDRERLRLQRFLSGLKVLTLPANANAAAPNSRVPGSIKKLTVQGANNLRFSMRDGRTATVAQYFQSASNRPLQYPALICVEVGSGALIPLERCEVPKGQLMRKEIQPDITRHMVEFSTLRPSDRLSQIGEGIPALALGQSEYVRAFGLTVGRPLEIPGRVLPPPRVKYGQGSKQQTIEPKFGAWNMRDTKLFKPATVTNWVVVIYEREQRFNVNQGQQLAKDLHKNCLAVGISIPPDPIVIAGRNGQANVDAELVEAGQRCKREKGGFPNLVVVVLPDGGNDIYTKVKHFGDIKRGVATQCVKSVKARNAKDQYWANVCLKVNVKLGGINSIPESVFSDPRQPTVIMGADVIHPAPGSEGRPSFTSMVCSVDTNAAKYIATCRVQAHREMIDDFQEMSKMLLSKHMSYKKNMEKASNFVPTRLIFYRDGVSEGEFAQVLQNELPKLRAACDELNIRPKITFIIVGKRHHFRFFPQEKDADRSGNAPAGLVIDTDIVHPVETDFYLLSHAGLLGTSRPAHYTVIHHENDLNMDALNTMSYALCHVYAKATRSVSIPAPVYYADTVCARAKHHYDPYESTHLSDTATATDAGQSMESFVRNFKDLHPNQAQMMYFS